MLRFFLQPGDFDIENGWAMNERNWAVLTAAENAVETAEQVRMYVYVCMHVHVYSMYL